MSRLAWLGLGAAVLLLLVPFAVPLPSYLLHLLVLALLWSFVATAWSIMGRFGMVSLGHGGFLGVGAYAPALLWNGFGLSPWLGAPVGAVLAVGLAFVATYPCIRLKIVGHYFALITMALAEVVRLGIVAARDMTGGALGMTPQGVPTPSWWAMQFSQKEYFYGFALVLWAGGLLIWRAVDRSVARSALDAIAEDDSAAASIGIDVSAQKLRVTLLSAGMTAVGGAFLGQYLMYLNPELLSGVGVSLQIVFAAIAGGVYTLLGATVGTVLTMLLTEGLRVLFGNAFIGAANTIYGLLLMVIVIGMPGGIVGAILARRGQGRRHGALVPASQA